MQCPFCHEDLREGSIWCRYCNQSWGDTPEAPPPSPQLEAEPESTPVAVATFNEEATAPASDEEDAYGKRKRELEAKRRDELASILKQVQKRMVNVRDLVNKGNPVEALREARDTQVYMRMMKVEAAPEVEDEKNELTDIVFRLENSGVTASRDEEPSTTSVLQQGAPKIILAIVLGLVLIYLFRLHQINDVNKNPGTISGTVEFQGAKWKKSPGDQPVLVVAQDVDSKAIKLELEAFSSAKDIWNDVKTRAQSLHKVAEATTDADGSYRLDVPGGSYFVVVTSPDTNPPQSWFVEVSVESSKTSPVALRASNALRHK